VNRIRLHLGCGLVHRPGWVNVDRHSQPAADIQADAGALPFADASVQAIEALQLVEHLGYVGTLCALHEWARLLAPANPDSPGDRGALRIETPDRTGTLRAALSADTQVSALPWLFGAEQEGQAHRYLFSGDELAAMLRTAGFESVAVENAGDAAARPTLRLTAMRGADTPAVRFRIKLHCAFVASGLVVPRNAVQHGAVLETLCDRAAAQVETPGVEALTALFSLAVRYSPVVAACVLDSLPDPGAWPAAELVALRRLAEELGRECFTARLACRWRRLPVLPGTADVAWAALEREISLYLAARITPSPSLEAIRAGFDAATGDRIPTDGELDLFTREALRDLARRLTAQGVKSFAAGRLPAAAGALETALAYDVDSVWARWNLARLCLSQGRQLDALAHYEALQANAPRGLRTAFEREMGAVVGRSRLAESYGAPLADPADLLERPA
jgi:predicted SAM-dependent methyltransferase